MLVLSILLALPMGLGFGTEMSSSNFLAQQVSLISDSVERVEVAGQWLCQELPVAEPLGGNHLVIIGSTIRPEMISDEPSVIKFTLEKRYAGLQLTVLSPYIRDIFHEFLAGNTKNSRGSIIVEGDGKTLLDVSVTCNDAPLYPSLDLSGVSELTIRARGSIAINRPVLSRGVSFQPEPPVIRSPLDGATIREDKLSASWRPVPSATSYLVLIYPHETDENDLASIAGAPLMFFEKSADAVVDIAKLPDGRYKLEVVGISDGAIVPPFSSPTGFVVARKATPLPPRLEVQKVKGPEPPAGIMLATPIASFGIGRRIWGEPLSLEYEGLHAASFTGSCDYVKIELFCRLEYPGFSEVYSDGIQVFRRTAGNSEGVPATYERLEGRLHTLWVPTHGSKNVEVRANANYFTLQFYKLDQVALNSPKDGLACEDGKVWCRWAEMASADRYLIRFYCTKPDGPSNGKQWGGGYMLSEKGRSEIMFDLTKMPKGWYEWQVLPFKSGKAIGVWSEPFQVHLK